MTQPHKTKEGWFALLIVLIMGTEFVVSFVGATPSKATAWLLTHDLGYATRIVIPELSRLIWGGEHYGHLIAITVNGLIALALIAAAYLVMSVKAVRGRNDLLPVMIVLFALAPPGGFAFFAYDFDRPATVFVYAIAIAVLLALGRWGSRLAGAAACALGAGAMTLVHEAAIVTTVPLILACLALAVAEDERADGSAGELSAVQKMLLCAAPALLALLVLLAQKPLDEAAISAIIDLTRVRADFIPQAEAISAPTLSLGQQFADNAARLQTTAGVVGLVTALLALLPCLAAAWLLLGRLGAWSEFSSDSRALRFGAAACLLPLVFCIFSRDYGRWVAYAGTNLSLFLLFAFLVDLDVPPDLARPGRDHWTIIMAALAIQFLLGHNGYFGGPPALQHRILHGIEMMYGKPAPPAHAAPGPITPAVPLAPALTPSPTLDAPESEPPTP